MIDALNIQYLVLSDRQIHFGKLYWQSIAIHIVGLILVFAFFEESLSRWPRISLVCIGGATVLMGFIIHRLRDLEKRYEILLSNIEDCLLNAGHHGVQRIPKSGRYGARFIMNMVFYCVGSILIVSGVFLL